MYELTSPERTNWNYVPAARKGLSWGEMNEPQKEAARNLLKGTLSTEGLAKVEAIRDLEVTLKSMENGNPGRDPSKYWFVFFGKPTDEQPWVWRYEGHHCSLTFGNHKGTQVSSTPQFLGSNPAEVKIDGPKKGLRVLGAEQDLGFKLVESLSPDQLSKAVLDKVAPSDIITTTSRKAAIEGHLGVPFAELTPSQKKTLVALIDVHSSVQSKSEQARRRTSALSDAGSIVFAWIGPVSRAGRHYYRIQSKSFLIEYDNTQTDGNHIHTVWRDFNGDFGEDVLAEHYAEGHR